MSSNRLYGKTGFFRIAAILLAFPPFALAQSYTITELGGLKGRASEASALNNLGQVVGTAVTETQPTGTAILWDGGRLFDLGGSDGTGINCWGQIALYAGGHATLWENGRSTDLGTLGGRSSYPTAINEGGQIVGDSDINPRTSSRHAFLWDQGQMTDLGTLGARFSYAQDLNNVRQVVGYALLPSTLGGGAHAFLWEKGQLSDLGTLGGRSSEAHAINDSGQVVGSSDTRGETNRNLPPGIVWEKVHAFLWQKGEMTDLGTLGGDYSTAVDLNSRGQIIGSATTVTGQARSFLWQKGQMSDLQSLILPEAGWEGLIATAINDVGQIVGYGSHGGQPRAFQMSPAQ